MNQLTPHQEDLIEFLSIAHVSLTERKTTFTNELESIKNNDSLLFDEKNHFIQYWRNSLNELETQLNRLEYYLRNVIFFTAPIAESEGPANRNEGARRPLK